MDIYLQNSAPDWERRGCKERGEPRANERMANLSKLPKLEGKMIPSQD